MKDRYAQSSMRKQTNRMTFGEVRKVPKLCLLCLLFLPVHICVLTQIEQDAYQEDLGLSTGQLGKGGVAGPVRGPTVDKKTQVSISKRLQVSKKIGGGGGDE